VDEESQLWGTVCTLRDITPRKKVEAALRTSEARYRAVVEDQTELIFRYQEDGTLTFVNDAYCRFFNKVAQDAIGRNLYSIISPEEAALFKKPVDNAENVVKIEEKIILESGEMRWVDWTKRAIVVGDRNLTEYQV